jgi:hypothetical protein
MKKTAIFLALLGFLGFTFIPISQLNALMWRPLALPDMKNVSGAPNTMTLYGQVQKTEDVNGVRKVTLLVKKSIKGGNYKEGDTVVLSFINTPSHTLRLGMIQAPSFQEGEETVGCFTMNAKGYAFYCGGEDQSRFWVQDEGEGKKGIYNRQGNKYLVPPESSNPLMQHIVQGMIERNSGTILLEDFEKAINE